MTPLSTPETLPIDPRHVALQFSRRGNLADAQFLYGEVARRMDERLRLVRLDPKVILDAGCGAGQQMPLLRARYPDARCIGQDHNAALIKHARKLLQAGWRDWMARVSGDATRPTWLESDLARTGLAPESVDLVWSNLALHWHPAPHDVLQEWVRVLRLNGLVFFSCFGPGTMQQLRAALTQAGLRTATPSFVDMHDFGDLLIEKGFADPVMDQEVLTLTYETADKLLQDVRALGGNPALGRRGGLVGRSWRKRLVDALEAQRQPDGKLHLTIEVAYGHSWRTGTLRANPNETRVSVSAIQRKSPRAAP